MTTLLKTLTTLVLSTFLLTGCAIKKEDSLPMKTVKHAANTPLYVGEVAENALFFVAVSPIIAGALVKKGFDTLVSSKETKIED
ncbi:MAG: hypothetical protein WC149_09515 [Arcobacteraceae bacterium]